MNLFILKTKFYTCLTFSRIFENSRMIFRCSVFLLWIIPHMMRLLLQAFVRMAISYERRVDCVRVVASWEKFDEVLARRPVAFSGLVVRDEKRVVIQARHDGGRFNLAYTWLESRSQCLVQPVPRFRNSHEGARDGINPQGRYVGAPF